MYSRMRANGLAVKEPMQRRKCVRQEQDAEESRVPTEAFSHEQSLIAKRTMDAIRDVIAAFPENYQAHDMLGTLLQHLNRSAEAVDEFCAALHYNPLHGAGYNHLSDALDALGPAHAWESALARRRAAKLGSANDHRTFF